VLFVIGEEGEEEESCARRVTINNGRSNGSSRGASLYSNGNSSNNNSSRSNSGRGTALVKQTVSVPVRADTALALKARALVQEAVDHECWGIENPHVSTSTAVTIGSALQKQCNHALCQCSICDKQ
jgi:hypothetical protein